VARSAAGVHPVIGLWPVGLAEDIEATLARGRHKVGDFIAAHEAIEVDFPAVAIGGKEVDPFFNINRPDDLAEAEALIEERAP
jgi:molybdopterin-guanine dinucleotide biosynthesis protein A